MDEEKKLILKMLKEDKISEEEAIKLLDALGKKKPDKDYNDNFDFEEFGKNLANKVASGLDWGFRKSRSFLSNVDTDDWSFDSFSFSNNTKTEETYQTDPEDIERLEVENINGKIHVYSWDKDYIETIGHVNYDDKYFDDNYKFIEITKDEDLIKISINTEKRKNKFSVDLVIALPKNKLRDIELSSVNGPIIAEILDLDSLEMNTVNGSINAGSISANKLEFSTTSGAIKGAGLDSKEIKAETNNGSIKFDDFDSQVIDMATVNGSIKLNDFALTSEKINLNTVNGSIKLCLASYNRPIFFKAECASKYISNVKLNEAFKEIVKEGTITKARTESYPSDDEKNLEINCGIVTGSIKLD